MQVTVSSKQYEHQQILQSDQVDCSNQAICMVHLAATRGLHIEMLTSNQWFGQCGITRSHDWRLEWTPGTQL